MLDENMNRYTHWIDEHMFTSWEIELFLRAPRRIVDETPGIDWGVLQYVPKGTEQHCAQDKEAS